MQDVLYVIYNYVHPMDVPKSKNITLHVILLSSLENVMKTYKMEKFLLSLKS